MRATLLERQQQVHRLQFSEDAGHAIHGLNDTLEGLQGYTAQVGESVGNTQLPLAMLASIGARSRCLPPIRICFFAAGFYL
jgi:hypothetical protein